MSIRTDLYMWLYNGTLFSIFSEELKLCTYRLVFSEGLKLCTCRLVFSEELKLCTCRLEVSEHKPIIWTHFQFFNEHKSACTQFK